MICVTYPGNIPSEGIHKAHTLYNVLLFSAIFRQIAGGGGGGLWSARKEWGNCIWSSLYKIFLSSSK